MVQNIYFSTWKQLKVIEVEHKVILYVSANDYKTHVYALV